MRTDVNMLVSMSDVILADASMQRRSVVNPPTDVIDTPLSPDTRQKHDNENVHCLAPLFSSRANNTRGDAPGSALMHRARMVH